MGRLIRFENHGCMHLKIEWETVVGLVALFPSHVDILEWI